jgi:hypothetical protein
MPQPIDRDTLREIVRALIDEQKPDDAFFAYLSAMDWPVIPPRGPSSLARNWERMNDGRG